MYDKVLIPVDGSDVSNHAASEGFSLAKLLGSEVILLYITDMAVLTIPDAELGVSDVEAIRESFRGQGDRVIKSLMDAASAAGVTPRALMVEGDVHEEIIGAAEREKADLIIIGTHGRRGLNRLLLGSVAESVARRAPCPVLLIRPN